MTVLARNFEFPFVLMVFFPVELANWTLSGGLSLKQTLLWQSWETSLTSDTTCLCKMWITILTTLILYFRLKNKLVSFSIIVALFYLSLISCFISHFYLFGLISFYSLFSKDSRIQRKILLLHIRLFILPCTYAQ